MRTNAQAALRFVKSPLITENYPSVSIRSENDELYTIMQFVEGMFPNVAIIMCQRSQTPSVQYANANCKKILGYDPMEIKRMKLPDFLTLIHPDDILDVQQCFASINASEPYDPLLYRFEIHYRLRHKKGHYVHIADEKLAMKCRGEQYIYLNILKDVTSEIRFHDVNMNIYQYVAGEYKKVQTYIPRQGQSDFTPRQKDIVNLIEKGFSNQEIADQLSVSVNTIKNHKSMLFRKIKVRSSIELLRVTREMELSK